MISQVVIQDADRRVVFLLDDDDFARQREWCSSADGQCGLKPAHHHHVIQRLLDTMSGMSDEECADKSNGTVQHLTFFLCSLIASLQDRTEGHVDLLRIIRHAPHLSYEFTATLDLQ